MKAKLIFIDHANRLHDLNLDTENWGTKKGYPVETIELAIESFKQKYRYSPTHVVCDLDAILAISRDPRFRSSVTNREKEILLLRMRMLVVEQDGKMRALTTDDY